MNAPELYEKKIITDPELPVQINTHRVSRQGPYFDPHWHEYLEMHYYFRGEGQFVLDQTPLEVSGDTLVIANANELHQGICLKTPLEDCRIIFRSEDISPELALPNPIFANVIRDDGHIREIFQALQQEEETRLLGYKAACKGLVAQLLVYLSRNYVTETLSPEDSLRRKKNRDRLNQVLLYMESNYMNAFSNQELADMVYLSKDRFEHFFRENIGISPRQYVNELRLKKALQLLQRGEMSNSEIAQAAGFRDYNHFGRLFRNFYGCTPNQMRGR